MDVGHVTIDNEYQTVKEGMAAKGLSTKAPHPYAVATGLRDVQKLRNQSFSAYEDSVPMTDDKTLETNPMPQDRFRKAPQNLQ